MVPGSNGSARARGSLQLWGIYGNTVTNAWTWGCQGDISCCAKLQFMEQLMGKLSWQKLLLSAQLRPGHPGGCCSLLAGLKWDEGILLVMVVMGL